MIVAGTPQQKKATLFGGSGKSSPAAASSPASSEKQGKPTRTARSQRCCRGINDCMSMGSIVSTNQQQQQHHHHHLQSTSKLEQQVVWTTAIAWNSYKVKARMNAYYGHSQESNERNFDSNFVFGLAKVEDLTLEVEKQKELRIMYRKRMERTQDYLRYCLQIAQDNGFLELMINNKEDQHQSLLPSNLNNINASPQLPIRSPSHQNNSYLSVTIDQAKMNGWYINPNEIELQEKIGRGSTAEIYRGIWRGLDVAVKCINPDFFHTNVNGVTFFAQELDTLCRQRHRFVLQLMGACLDPPDNGWVVTEFLSTTLKEWLHGPGSRRKERTVPLPHFRDRLARALEIAQAMQYLHEQKPKVCHRDLKPSNIFLDDANHVRVADFGHARFLTDEEKALTGETGKDYRNNIYYYYYFQFIT
ncbi:hypothetical protein JRO89_XS03G0295600 [Xanthoceras sorbifolium]|uniref:Protein kinase domain-containing protein n=1 Tax=Xanthoceras sorbifolium TaxID=99658 RepID=A0ABQ8ICV7_9ROSI|nr:hypothetical protein JRO89_XS03G0295600 [Xanthoceras sorbifolium]